MLTTLLTTEVSGCVTPRDDVGTEKVYCLVVFTLPEQGGTVLGRGTAFNSRWAETAGGSIERPTATTLNPNP